MAGNIRPKPNSVKLLTGSRRANKEAPAFRSAIDAEMPVFPARLRMLASSLWKQLIPELQANPGLAMRVDANALAAYCCACAEVQVMDAVINEEGWFVRSNANGLTAHPAVAVRNKAYDRLLKFAIEFGFTPAARSRVKVPDAPADAKAQAWAAA